MIGKIIKSTSKKPCSCPSGKLCTACKKKTVIHPQLYVEEPKNLPASISITYHKAPNYNQNQTVQFLEKTKIWKVRKRPKYEPEQKTTPLCRWYKRRKAFKQLVAEHKREQEILRKKRREEYERERIKELMKWDREREKALSSTVSKNIIWTRNKRSTSLPPLRKKLYIRERSASVRPRAQTKSVAAKRYNTRETISRRFVNYCYRLCCQFYCYLTFIILIIVTVLFII